MNWNVERQMEKAQERLDESLAKGEISQADYNAEIREMSREYNDMAREAAESEFQSWY